MDARVIQNCAPHNGRREPMWKIPRCVESLMSVGGKAPPDGSVRGANRRKWCVVMKGRGLKEFTKS